MALFIDCEIVHADICVFLCRLKTWKLERPNRVHKRKLRATHRERRRVPRKRGDWACRDSGSGMVGGEASQFRRKTRGVFIILSKAIVKKSSQCLTSCVLLLYCCTSIDISTAAVGRTKYVIVTTLDPNPNPNPNWNAMG